MDAIFQQLLRYLLAPPCRRVRVGEVDIGAHLVPELADDGIAIRVRHEPALRGQLIIERMRDQQCGLEIGDQFDPRIGIGLYETAHIGEFLTVPVEDVTLVANRGIARGEVEALTRNVVALDTFDEFAHPLLRVGGVGIGHGRAGIAHRPARLKRGPPGQPCVTAGDLARVGPGDHVIIEIAAVGAHIAVMRVIIVMLMAEIETRIGGGVVKHAVGRARFVDHEDIGDGFIQRIIRAGIIAHRVQIGQAEATARAIHRPGALAKGVIAFPALARDVMIGGIVPPAEIIDLRRAVLRDQLPCAIDPLMPGAEEPFTRDGDAQAGGGDGDVGFGFLDGEVGSGKAFDAHPVATRFGNIALARRDGPAGGGSHLALRQQQDADDILFGHENMRDGARIGAQGDARPLPLGQRKAGRMGKAGFTHEYRADQVESAKAGEKRGIADPIGQLPDGEREEQPAGPSGHADQPVGLGNIALGKDIGGKRVDEDRDDLMRKAAQRKQHDGRIRAGDKADAARRDHHYRAQRNPGNARPFKGEPAPALQERREIAAQNAPRIGGQKRHPCEKRDLGDVHAALLGQIERDPEGKGLPRRFRQKARDGDGPETFGFGDGATRGGCRFNRTLSCADCGQFLGRDIGGIARRAIELIPCGGEQHAQRGGDDKGRLPAIDLGHHGGQHRRDHRAERGARIEPAHSHRAFTVGEPLTDGLHARRDRGGLGHAQHAPKRGQREPAPRRAMGHIGKAPCQREEGKACGQTNLVNQHPADRLH
ncbi:hypothetical protein E4T56_gene2382, partial [Termitomyces sp. T112]